MTVCAISFKECWQNPDGTWWSDGGFPMQMDAVGSLFESMTLLIVGVDRRDGGIPLPAGARIVPMARPAGEDLRRKISVAAGLPYYAGLLFRHIHKADAVHVPLPGDIPFLGMLLALAARKRMIVRYGGSWANNSRTTVMNRLMRLAMRVFAGGRNVMLVTGAHTGSARLESIFATALSRGEVERTRPELDRGLSAPPRLLYLGRLAPGKGVRHLVDAVGMLAECGFEPLPRVRIAGDGPERAELESLVRHRRCGDLIGFTGRLDRAGLEVELRQADICVQPSLTEGFSKAWLDAMVHGVPVLASRVGAAAEVMGQDGERGWLTAPGDTPGLASALRRVLIEPRDWPALRRRCRDYAASRTLEAWRDRIGEICARQWRVPVVGGKLLA